MGALRRFEGGEPPSKGGISTLPFGPGVTQNARRMLGHVDVSDTRTTASREDPWYRMLAWPLGLLALILVVVAAILLVLSRHAPHFVDSLDAGNLGLPLGFAVIGTLLVSRVPRNRMGWILLAIAVLASFSGTAIVYVFHSTRVHALPLARWVAWAQNWVAALLFPSGLATFLFLLFPDGHIPSRRWRWVAWAACATMVVYAVVQMDERTIQLNGSPALRSPLGRLAVIDPNGPAGLIFLPVALLLVVAMVGLFVRARRSTGVLRQQLRWLAYTSLAIPIALVLIVVIGAIYPHLSNVWWTALVSLGFGVAIPLSCAVAILKHGLYELDVVVTKTVVYGVLAAFFTAVYAAVVVGVGAAVGSARNPLLTVVAALVIALAFNPVRERAKRFANRLVYGKRATPYEVLSEFAERMSETYALEDVLPRMARILAEGTVARRATVWLHVGTELRPAASWGPDGDNDDQPLPVLDGALPPLPGISKAVPVRDRGELLGALSVSKPPNEPLSEAEGKLVEDLAGQAGLVLRNVRLTEELRTNLEELRASRQRIVAAQDQERRRLERDIHDGAQQQLVALAVKANLAEQLIDRDAGKARALVADLRSEAQDALENLRDLARGIYPPLLADQGLEAALTAQARKSPVPVTVEVVDIGRMAPEAEAAVYFCALEALQNVSKYANATGATVRVNGVDGLVVFEVTDDGVGFDPSAQRYGTGMQGMADRLAALGGDLVVTSRRREGTTVRGSLPIVRTSSRGI